MNDMIEEKKDRSEQMAEQASAPTSADPATAVRTDPAAPLAAEFGKYGLLCLAVGIFYTFCFYKNPHSITWPLFTAAGYWLLCRTLCKLGVRVKKDSWFPAAVSLLLSISMCLTASRLLHFYSRLAIVLLLAIFLIHQFYEEYTWDIGKYMCAIVKYIFTTVLSFGVPFRHAVRYTGSRTGSKRGKNFLMAAAGLCFSIPFAMIIILLLGDADAVFGDFTLRLFKDVLSLKTILAVSIESLVAAVLFYCILCSRYKKTISEEVKDRRMGNPILAVSFLAIFVLAYLLFCGIQVFYLFLHQGTLPESMTYAEYAHEGFFQLVLVVFVNLVLVLLCLKYFKQNPVLRLTLTVLSICTLIMTASASYRILLYIHSYQLTFLRLLVLWFLVMTAVLMLGIFLLIYKETFPLFRYCVVVVSIFYTCFVLVRPDAVIAKYNLTCGSPLNYSDYSYLRTLSVDALPALYSYLPDAEIIRENWDSREEFLRSFSKRKIGIGHKTSPENSKYQLSPRRYNFSEAKAIKIISFFPDR